MEATSPQIEALAKEQGSEQTSAYDSDQVVKSPKYSKVQWFLLLCAIYSTQLLYGLDITIVADIQGAAVRDLGEIEKLGWLAIGFPLGGIAAILTLGKAYSMFDIKWIYIGSAVMFTAASALCGAAPNMDALIIGRVWAGAGGAGMYLGVLNLVSVNTKTEERSIYIGISGIIWGLGCVLGPIVGGSLADSGATWRWAFYINLCIFGAFAPVVLLVIRPFSFQPTVSFLYKIKNMDWLGVVLNAGMFALFVVLFTFAGVQWAWDSTPVIVLFIFFGLVTIAFVGSQYFCLFTNEENRIFPGDFLKSKNLILLYICQAAAASAMFMPIYYIPLYSQFVYGDSSLKAAVRLLPFICVSVASNMLSGALMPKYGYYKPWFLVSAILITIGGALFYTLIDMNSSSAYLYGFSVLLALGAGLTQQTAYSVAAARVPVSRLSDAIGFINTAQIGGMVIALTITSSIFQIIGFNRVSEALDGFGFSAVEIRSLLSGRQSEVFLNTSPEIQRRVVESVSKTISLEYVLLIAAGAVQTIASVLLPGEKLTMTTSAGMG